MIDETFEVHPVRSPFGGWNESASRKVGGRRNKLWNHASVICVIVDNWFALLNDVPNGLSDRNEV